MARKYIRATAAVVALGLGVTAARRLHRVRRPTPSDTGDPTEITMLVLGDKPTNGRLEKMLDKLNERAPREGERQAGPVLRRVGRLADPVQPAAALGRRPTSTSSPPPPTGCSHGRTPRRAPSCRCTRRHAQGERTQDLGAGRQGAGDWDLTKLADGQIYFIPEDDFTQYTNHGFFYRGDWAKAAGFENGNITKFEDFTKYFQWVKDNKPEAYPWDVAGDPSADADRLHAGPHRRCRPSSRSAPATTTRSRPPRPTRTRSPRGTWRATQLIEAAELAKQWNEIGVVARGRAELRRRHRARSCTRACPAPTSTTPRPSSAGLRQPLEEAAGLRPEVLLLGPGERQRLQGHQDARCHGRQRLLAAPGEGAPGLRPAPQRQGVLPPDQLRHRGHATTS